MKTKKIQRFRHAYYVEVQIGEGKRRDIESTVTIKYFPSYDRKRRDKAFEFAGLLNLVSLYRVRVYVVCQSITRSTSKAITVRDIPE